MNNQLSFHHFEKVLKWKHFLKCFLAILVLTAWINPAYSQKGKTSLGSVEEFHSEMRSAKVSWNSRKSVKVKKSQLLDIVIHNSKESSKEDSYVGKVAGAQTSYAFFNFKKDGSLNGKVVIPGKKEAYTYFSENGTAYVSPTNIEEVICTEYEEQTAGASSSAELIPPPTSYVFNLQSLPGAGAVVMLDFDGHDAKGSWWGDINALPADNATETDIEEAWRVMAEDFRPFALNITTSEAVYQAAPANRRMRCIFTPTTDAAPGWGGVAFIGSFQDGGEVAPCWVFNIWNGKLMGETGSHEIGHTLGLFHDGRYLPGSGTEDYYGGHGNWAPIMGVSFSPTISQWSIGDYKYANNTQDDIAIMATQNGFGFRADAQGNTAATAANLVVGTGGVVNPANNYGIIANRADVDYFRFTSNGNSAILTVTPAPQFPDLDMKVSIVNSSGVVFASSNPIEIAPCSLHVRLPSGTYYLVVDGSGFSTPTTNGYSDYGSIGEYRVSGTINSTTHNTLPTISITSPSNGASFPYGTSITITANAADADGSVSKVDFYNGKVYLGSDTEAPYSALLDFDKQILGYDTLTAIVTDNRGAQKTSNPIIINITPQTGINGANCVVSGEANVYFMNLEYPNFNTIQWWINGDATIQQDPSDPKKATITFSSYNPGSVTVHAGITYVGVPYYVEYSKVIQVNNCFASRQAVSAMTFEEGEEVSVKVFDLNGREVLSSKTSSPNTYIENQILAPGMYLFQVIRGEESYTQKIVK